MGRFETSAEFYGFREPYPPTFFKSVVARLSLDKESRLLDVGCGPGNLAIGLRPFVGYCTAIDPEAEMLRVAQLLAQQAGADVMFIHSTIQELEPSPNSFDLVTVGRALHWLPQKETLTIFERVVAPGGHVAICVASTMDPPANPWISKFKEVRKAWSNNPDESCYHVDLDQWFAGSAFRRVDTVSVSEIHQVTISDLVSRGLSFSVTSPAALGERRPAFESAMRAALEPFASEGALQEQVEAKATIFARA